MNRRRTLASLIGHDGSSQVFNRYREQEERS
jgi:hypothetical protein